MSSTSTDESTPDTATIETTTQPLTFPDSFDTSGSRDQKFEYDKGGWINDAERMVWLMNSGAYLTCELGSRTIEFCQNCSISQTD